jgi:hypothetical protein
MATVLTNTGKAIAANRILAAGTEPKFIAWGTGAGTAAATDTTLFTEAAEARTSGTSSRVTSASPAVTNDTYRVTGTITATGAKTITNAGTFDVITSSSGNLFVKGDHSGTALAVGESIAYTIDLTFT